ncbi:MAG TPA: ABC transporter substrate-binding protein [Acetobacteraceae bacterium]|jgi:putative spermidine/putrescine transport system substrate-binding protein|nr:ABC transporter substrate-binding protein [Acetobacteraceae bacterium]
MSHRNITTSRRRLLGTGLGAATLLAAPRIVRAADSQMVVVSSGGALEDAYREAIYKPWTQKTGIQVVTGPNAAAKLKAMVEAKAVEWDVAQLDAAAAAMAARQGLLEKLDYSVIDRNGVLEGMARDYYIVSDLAGTVLSWNTDRLKGTPPANWAEAWDLKKFSGSRGILKRASQTLEIALMADGVAPDKLYPLDVPRALHSLEKIKTQIYWWDSGAQGAQIIIDGDVSMAMEWQGRVDGPKTTGAKVDYHLNQALYASDSWAVPKGAKDLKRSMEFIAFAMQGPQQLAYSKLLPYGPVSKAAISMMDPAQLAHSPSSPEVLARGAKMNFEWWAENNEKVSDQFNRWVLAG